METTIWECVKVSHEITAMLLIMALPLLALGAGKFRKRGTVITWKFFGGGLSLLVIGSGLLILFNPVLYPEDPVLSSLPLRLALSLPILLSWPIVYWVGQRTRMTFLYHFPVENFFPWIDEQIRKTNTPLKIYTEEYMAQTGWMAPRNFDPKYAKAWRHETDKQILITAFQVSPGGKTIMGSIAVQGKGDRKKLDPLLEKIEKEIGKIEVKPSPGVGLAFIVPGALIVYALIYGIYVVCFTPPPL